MCKFHKDIARKLATNPKSGEMDLAKYAVALTAMAKYRIEQYMPTMSGTSGYDKGQITGPKAQRALGQMGVSLSMDGHKWYQRRHLPRAAKALDKLFSDKQLTLAKLGLPKDEKALEAVLDVATVELFDGAVTGPHKLVNQAPRPEHEALRKATEAFLDTPRIEPVLKRLFEGSIVNIFMGAWKEMNQARRAGKPWPPAAPADKPCHGPDTPRP